MNAVSSGPGGMTSHTGEESSASSIINVDMSEGILVPEADAEVGIADGEAGNVYVRTSLPVGDEASKKALRDHLRRTLNKKESYPGACHSWTDLRLKLL
jgi:vacuolar fusion protein MON1